MSLSSLPLSHRKHSPDCGPCFLPRGLHSPDTRPQPPKLQGLCPSCPQGQFFALAPTLISFLRYPFQFLSILVWEQEHFFVFSFADSLLGFLCLWGNGRHRGVAAGWPTHLASDSWTQSQFQLEGNANAWLKDMLFGPLYFVGLNCWKEYLFLPTLLEFQPNDQKNWVWLPS